MFHKPFSFFQFVGFARIQRRARFVSLLLAFFSVPAAFAQTRRIVSLAPSATEWIDAFGLTAQLVGVTEQCDYPPAVKTLAKVGSFMRTSVEQVLIRKPTDVVAVDGLPASLSQQFTARGIRVHVFSVQKLEDFPREIRKLGEALGAKSRADVWAEKFEKLMKRKSLPTDSADGQGPGRPTSFLMLVSLQPLFVASHHSWLSELFEHSGMVNATRQLNQIDANSGQFLRLSRESVLSLRVDQWISFADAAGDTELLRERVVDWRSRSSVKKDLSIRIFPADVFTRPGPRLIYASQQLQDSRQ